MGLRLSVTVNIASQSPASVDSTAAAFPSGSESSGSANALPTATRYTSRIRELPQDIPENDRVYLVWATVAGKEHFVGIHWSEGTAAYKVLKTAVGWGGLRKWRCSRATSASEIFREFCAETSESGPVRLSFVHWAVDH